MPRLASLPVLILVILISGGCSVLEQSVQKPTVTVTQVTFKQASLQEGILDARIQISNPNNFSLPVKGITYRLKLNEREFANSSMTLESKLPAQGSVQASVPITFRYVELIEGLGQLLSRQRIHFQLGGEADLGLISVPYSKSGEFDLRF